MLTKLFKRHNSSAKEEKELSSFEQEKQVISKTFTEVPEYCGKHKVDIHMNDGSLISYKCDDETIIWLLANMAQQTNVALQWDHTNKRHRAINMKKVVYIEFNTVKDKEDDNEEVA